MIKNIMKKIKILLMKKIIKYNQKVNNIQDKIIEYK
jgi:hypothetical protein